MSSAKIGALFDCSKRTILNWLERFNIPSREGHPAWNKGKKGLYHTKKKIEISRNELYDLYITEELNTMECSKILNCSAMTIWHRLREFNIPLRFEHLDIEKNALVEFYVERRLSIEKISKILGYSSGRILRSLKKFGIPRRTLSEAHLGIPAWNKGRKGIMPEPWNKGKKGLLIHSQISREKISKGLKGIKRSEEWKEKHRGKNHGRWKGGITSLVRRIRNSYKYRQWRSDVFTRDDFTCQECGRRGGCLHAHHKEAFADIMEFNDIKTYEQAMNCEELWNVNNGITYCKKYHCKLKSLLLSGGIQNG